MTRLKRCAALTMSLVCLALMTTHSQQVAVQLTLSVNPPAIFLPPTTPQQATITLHLVAGGGERAPADFFVVVDRSATANIEEIQRIGSAIVEALLPQDRVGLISFGNEARLDVPLTFDHEAVRQGLKLLRRLGKTAVGEGIARSVDELQSNGRAEASWAMVLVSDGRWNVGRTPLSQAQRAAESGISIFTIAIKTLGRSPDTTLLRELARLTKGQFFETFSATVPQEIAKSLGRKLLARQIKITLTLPTFLTYELATLNAPNRVTKNPDNTTTLEWVLEEFFAGESWEASFTVIGAQLGSALLRPSFSYIDARGRTVTPDVAPVSISVREQNRPPRPMFDFTPSEPTVNDQVVFIDRSTDPDGKIVSWEWEFGDGARALEQSPTHRYAADGTYTVTLTITDNDGAKATTTKPLKVFTPKAIAIRTIDTNLSGDQTIPGEKVKVTLTIRATTRLSGLSVIERVPNWEKIEITTTESAFYRILPAVGNVKEIQWIFNEALDAGAMRTLQYELTVSEDPPVAQVVKLSGVVSSALPAFEMTTGGETEINVVIKLLMRIVFARMEKTADGSWNVNLWLTTNTIGFEQMAAAISLFWMPQKPVTNKNPAAPEAATGKVNFGTIDLKTLQELVAYWLTDTSVFEPLPK